MGSPSHFKLFVYYCIVHEPHLSITYIQSGIMSVSLISVFSTPSTVLGSKWVLNKYLLKVLVYLISLNFHLHFFFLYGFLPLPNRGYIFLYPIEVASSLNLLDSAVDYF